MNLNLVVLRVTTACVKLRNKMGIQSIKSTKNNPRLPKEIVNAPHHLPHLPENRLDLSDMEGVGNVEVLRRAAASLAMEQNELKRIIDVYNKAMLLCITEGYVVTVPNLVTMFTKVVKPREGVRGVLANGFERIEQWTVQLNCMPNSTARRIIRKNAKYIRETHGYEALFKSEPNKLLERNYFYHCIDRPKSERWAGGKDPRRSGEED
jgi:hypothetical protein